MLHGYHLKQGDGEGGHVLPLRCNDGVVFRKLRRPQRLVCPCAAATAPHARDKITLLRMIPDASVQLKDLHPPLWLDGW